MSWLAVGVTAVGVLGTGVAAATSENKVTQTSRVQFPKETRQLFQTTEEPLLRGSLQEQASLLAPLLGGFRTQTQAQQQQQTQRARALTLSAGRRGAGQGGVGNLGPLDQSLQGLDPILLEALQTLALQHGQKTQAVVPPGYENFLSPQTATSQEGGGPSGYEQGFQIASSLASVAGSIYEGR